MGAADNDSVAETLAWGSHYPLVAAYEWVTFGASSCQSYLTSLNLIGNWVLKSLLNQVTDAGCGWECVRWENCAALDECPRMEVSDRKQVLCSNSDYAC